MQPSKEQIENAARLVHDTVFISGFGAPYVQTDFERTGEVTRDWQPWADTEAGRSDALVLLAAVLNWLQSNDRVFDWPAMIREKWFDLDDALTSGNVQQIQAATFAAAAEIGANFPFGKAIKGVENELPSS